MFRWPWEKPPTPKKAVEEVSKLEEFKEHLTAIQAYVEGQVDNNLIYNGKAIPPHLQELKCQRLIALMLSNPDMAVHGLETYERKSSELLLLNTDVKKLTARIERDIALVRGEAVMVAKERTAVNMCRNVAKSVIFLTEDLQRAVDAAKILRDQYKEAKDDHGKGARGRADDRRQSEAECYELIITHLSEANTIIKNLVEAMDIVISLEQQLIRAELKGATPDV